MTITVVIGSGTTEKKGFFEEQFLVLLKQQH